MRIKCGFAFGEITTLPGCSQIAVSHSVYIPENKRGKGRATPANRIRQRVAFEELGYDMMLCTVAADNTSQIAVLRKTGWEYLTLFTSSKTGHRVELWCCFKR